MEVLPVSPAESSANGLKNAFKQSFKFTGELHVYENSNIKEESMKDGNSDFCSCKYRYC